MKFEKVNINGKLLPVMAKINSEDRRSPFKDDGNFLNFVIAPVYTNKGILKRSSLSLLTEKVNTLINAKAIKLVVFDSVSTMIDLITDDEFKKEKEDAEAAGREINGLQTWGRVARSLRQLRSLIKTLNEHKILVILSHEEEAGKKDPDKRVSAPIRGNGIAGGWEACFDVVMWTRINRAGNKKDGTMFQFHAVENTINRAHVPEGFLGNNDTEYMPNNLSDVLDRCIEYYDIKDPMSELGKFPAIFIVGQTGTGKTYSTKSLIKNLGENNENQK